MSTISEVLQKRLLNSPGETACVFAYPDKPHQTVTVCELLARAGDYARVLACERPASLVSICMYPSTDLIASFVGCIMAGHIPTMIAPPSPRMEHGKYTRSFQAMESLLKPVRCLVDPATREKLGEFSVGNTVSSVLLSCDVAASTASQGAAPSKGDDIAFVQHSSGTTGLQKGIALTHRSVLNQVESYSKTLRMSKSDIIVSWLPLYHDMGLVACMLLPLLYGIPFVQISPFDWVNRPVLLFDSIHSQRGTLCFLPNFGYEHLSRSVRDSSLPPDMLSSVRGFINCSEPVNSRTHRRFLQKFASIGARADQLWTCYAMAENVFAVTQSEIGQAASSEIVERRKFIESHRAIPINAPLGAEDEQLEYVSCGRSIGGTQFKVIGEDGVRCPERHVGEICVHGNSLFSGYFRRDDLTEQAFTPDGWYKTGDLGYEANDELYITGRKKDLIIVQGRNFYPHDIEAAAAEAPNIIPGRIVAFGVEDESLGTESIVVLAETDPFPPPDTAALALEIRKRVAQVLDCTLKDVRFVEPRWLVKSTSGKNAREDNKQKYYSQILQAGADHGSRNV